MTVHANCPDLISALETSPQGLSFAELKAVAEDIDAAVDEGLSDGSLEMWPFWPERIRATIKTPSRYLRAVAELRQAASSHQDEVHGHAGTPVTLHLLLGDEHAVIERHPLEHSDKAAKERAHYARPRNLRAGATGRALLAYMSRAAQAKFLGEEIALSTAPEMQKIRTQGFCLAEAASVPGGWVMSSAILASDGFPVAALCTYGGPIEPMERARLSGPALRRAARSLSESRPAEELRRRLRALGM